MAAVTDWRRKAEAIGIEMTEQELAIAESRLAALEKKLDEMVSRLEPGDDPAVIFRAEARAMIADQAAMLRRGEASSVELTRAALDRIERLNPTINAFITVIAESALARAGEMDAALARGDDRGSLHGVPIAVKDIVATRGVRTTSGSRIFADFVPDYDAEVVRRLEKAGAVLLGKTGMHELAYGITSNNPHFGAVRNPWDRDRIPGGSSGGSGAAVAAGICAMAIGTDTGGSIRIPAAFCGVAGFKPTYGAVSKRGVLPLGFSLDHIGPIAASVQDCAITMEAISGFDPNDPTSAHRGPEDYSFGPDLSIRGSGLRIGRPLGAYFEKLEPGVRSALDAVLRTAAEQGAEVVEVRVPDLDEMNAVALTILLGEAAAALEPYLKPGAEIGADVKLLLNQGRMLPATAYVNAQRLRSHFVREFASVWRDCDLLLIPATPTVAPRIGQTTVELPDGAEDVRLLTTRCVRAINMLGLPALVFPCGLSDGLPVGAQLVGPAFGDALVLRTGAVLEKALGPLPRPPLA